MKQLIIAVLTLDVTIGALIFVLGVHYGKQHPYPPSSALPTNAVVSSNIVYYDGH